jgi:hypothetical protein
MQRLTCTAGAKHVKPMPGAAQAAGDTRGAFPIHAVIAPRTDDQCRRRCHRVDHRIVVTSDWIVYRTQADRTHAAICEQID